LLASPKAVVSTANGPALSISVMLCATTGSFSMSRMRIEPPVHGVTLQRRGKAAVKAQPQPTLMNASAPKHCWECVEFAPLNANLA